MNHLEHILFCWLVLILLDSQCFFCCGRHIRSRCIEPFFMELVQRAVFLELGDGSIDFLLQFLIVLVEAEGKVLDFGIRNIDGMRPCHR